MPQKKNASARIIGLIKSKPPRFWDKEREKRMLETFHRAAVSVPAYKDFLRKHGVSPKNVKTLKDFEKVPPTSKKNYLKKYPLEKLCWEGNLEKPLVFTSTSGSTGEPFYFPRGEKLDWEYSILTELFLKNSAIKDKGPTLVIIGFGMGVWIGGLITYKAFEIMSRERNYPVSIITPGINKTEIYNALKNLAPHYAETIFVGYAPFTKDVLDGAAAQGINLKKLNLRLLFAAEAFPEKLRDYFSKKLGLKNSIRDTLNIYGSADIGAMAFETPLSILVRRLAMQKELLFHDVFSPIHKTPTLAQYNPLFVNFESQNGEVLITGDNTIPLIRYAIGDHGGAMSFGDVKDKLSRHGFDLEAEARKAGIPDCVWKMPFVFVYERMDFSTTLYGLQIYPETIREALIDEPLSDFLTGKFTMITRFDKKHNQTLELNLELQKNKNATPRLKKTALTMITTNLRKKNSEFRELSDYLGKRANPNLIFWPAEHPEYFRPGIKQKWVKK